jgi:hypothetical protein
VKGWKQHIGVGGCKKGMSVSTQGHDEGVLLIMAAVPDLCR